MDMTTNGEDGLQETMEGQKKTMKYIKILYSTKNPMCYYCARLFGREGAWVQDGSTVLIVVLTVYQFSCNSLQEGNDKVT